MNIRQSINNETQIYLCPHYQYKLKLLTTIERATAYVEMCEMVAVMDVEIATSFRK